MYINIYIYSDAVRLCSWHDFSHIKIEFCHILYLCISHFSDTSLMYVEHSSMKQNFDGNFMRLFKISPNFWFPEISWALNFAPWPICESQRLPSTPSSFIFSLGFSSVWCIWPWATTSRKQSEGRSKGAVPTGAWLPMN
jgi:hypothetical protein